MSQSKPESVQTNIAELKEQTEILEQQLARAQNKQDKEDIRYYQTRLLVNEQRLAEQERYQHEKDLLLLQAQTAGWSKWSLCDSRKVPTQTTPVCHCIASTMLHVCGLLVRLS